MRAADGQIMDQAEWFHSEISAQAKYEVGDSRHARGRGRGQERHVAGCDAVTHLRGKALDRDAVIAAVDPRGDVLCSGKDRRSWQEISQSQTGRPWEQSTPLPHDRGR